MIKKILTQLSVILLLLLFVVVISHKVLPIHGGISYNDSAYTWNIENKHNNIISAYSGDYLGISLLNGIFLYTPKGIISLGLSKIGISHEIISYILSFGYLLLALIVAYLIFSKISNNKFYGFLAAIFIIFNNASIEYIVFGQFFVFLYMLSLILLINILYNIYLRGYPTFLDSCKISLISVLLIIPLNLFTYSIIIFLSFLFYFIYFKQKQKFLLYGLLSGIMIFLIHSYWIIPFIIGLSGQDSSTIYSGNADNVLNGFRNVATFINTISFRQYFNIISYQLFPSTIVNLFYIILVPLIIIIGFFSNIRKNKFVLFLIFLYLLLFNLALGPNSPIFGGIFEYLWANHSIFHFFRSFTRFSIPIIVILLFIVGIFIKQRTNKFSNIIYIFGVVLIIFLHFPLLSGNLMGITKAIMIPEEYKQLNSLLGNNKNIIGYPNTSYETYHWAIGTSNLQREDYFMKENIIDSNIIYNRASQNFQTKNDTFKTIFGELNTTNEIINTLSYTPIDYVLVQKDLISVFNGSPIPFYEYYSYFNEKSKLVLDNEFFSLFQLNNPTNIVFSDNLDIDFTKITPFKYEISINNLDTTGDISFLNNFDSNFKLYLRDSESLSMKPLFENTHSKIYGYANSWEINKDSIIKYISNHSKESPAYSKNSDGTINIDFTLYYRPQFYYYYGLIISFISIIIIIGCLLYRKRKKTYT